VIIVVKADGLKLKELVGIPTPGKELGMRLGIAAVKQLLAVDRG
jgi:hypothetical protein